MGKPTGQRFKSVWDALPVDLLGDTISTPKRTNDRTNADKRKAVTTMLNDAEWAKWSDGAIAKACQVTQPFVSSVRKSLITVMSEEPAERTYTTKQGTTATSCIVNKTN